MLNYEGKTFDMRRCNAVALEVREMGGKREKKVVIFNAPESTEQRRTTTRKRLIWNKPWKSLRSSASKEFDRLALSGPRRDPAETPQRPRSSSDPAAFQTAEERERIVKKGWDGPALKNGVYITRDRTYNQRKEARKRRKATRAPSG